MNYTREQFNFDDKFRFQLFETTARQEILHCHDCLEINFIKHGTGHYMIDQKVYPIQVGDLFIINNSERHMAVQEEDVSILVMVFDSRFVWESPKEYDYLGPFFNRNMQFSNRIHTNNENYSELCDYIHKISMEYKMKKDGWQLVVKATVMLFLAVLYRYYQNSNELGGDAKNPYKRYERVYPIIDYIHESFTETLNLEVLSKISMMNKTYLCSFFKEVMNMTIFEYIQQVRINYSCMLLKTTDYSITEISQRSGYNGISYFNRMFKEQIGSSPKIYREKSKYSASSPKSNES